MLTFHANWFWVATVATGLAGMWGLGLALLRREPGRFFLVARFVAISVMIVQVAAGLYLYGQGQRPGNGFHVFYGVVIAATLSFAYIYRIQLERKAALGYGLLLLFIMGLGLRAWSNVS